MTELIARIYGILEDGTYSDLKLDFSLSDFNGVLPTPGDLIVDPGVVSGRDRSAPENRTVYEVVSRYFFPVADETWRYVALVCRERYGQTFEADIVTVH